MSASNKKESGQTVKRTPKCRELSAKKKEELFNLYVKPNLKSIYTLAKRYTDNYQDVDDNYNYCLAQLYNYIGSYNPQQKLDTWLHICTKRACFFMNKKRSEESSHWTDIEMCTPEDIYQHGTSMVAEATIGTLIDNISDEMHSVLMQIPFQRLSPFMLYVQGMRIREITEAEWQSGHLEKRSEETVRSRIYLARKQLQYLLRNKYGIVGKNRKSALNDRDTGEEDD